MESATDRPPLAGIALVSAAAIGYEVLLLRLLAIVQWHHFATLVISLALLGFGASGTVLAFVRVRVRARHADWFAGSAVLFALSAPACFLLAQRVPFNPLALPWDLGQLAWMTALYLVLSPPFVFAGLAIGSSLDRYAGRAGIVYAADLLGAGAGAVAIVLALYVLPEQRALLAITALGALAALAALTRIGPRARAAAAVVVIAAAVIAPAPALRISPYKPLAQAMAASGARIVDERSSPTGRVTAIENDVAPYRPARGLSLLTTSSPPPRVLALVDAGAPDAVADFGQPGGDNGYLDFELAAAPYAVLDRPRVLVLGSGGGIEVLRALHHRAAQIDAVEPSAPLIEVARARLGSVYGADGVRVHPVVPRSFLAGTADRFDLVSIRVPSASAAGLDALEPAPLLTVEGLAAALARLTPRGVLALDLGLRVPPRSGPRMFAAAIAALERHGVSAPEDHLVWLRGIDAQLILAAREPFDAAQARALRGFARARAFDVVHVPGAARVEPNRHNVLGRAWFSNAARSLLHEPDAFLERYKFDVRAATDDRPFFFDGFRWSHLGELAGLRARGGAGLLELGVPVLTVALAQSIAVGALLIAAPLLALRDRTPEPRQPGAPGRLRTFGFFASIGLGFLLVEVAWIHRLVLVLGHPALATACVLAAFLVFAGLGSLASTPLRARLGAGTVVRGAAATTAVATAGFVWVFTSGLDGLLAAPLGTRVAVVTASIACLATPMGMPFPCALAVLERHAPRRVPWAWAVNGCASVTGAVLATFIALHAGLGALLATGLGCYLAAAAFAPRD